jgi:cytolysin (calcineurin-like family phosphatase)
VNTWTVFGAVLTSFGWLLWHISRAEGHIVEHLDRQTRHLQGVIKVSSQDDVNAVVDQLGKAKGEILTEIAALQAQVDAGQPVDLSALKAAAQGLDDLNVDAEPEAPAE